MTTSTKPHRQVIQDLNEYLIKQYLLKKPKIKKIVCFKGSHIFNDYITPSKDTYIAFPYIIYRRKQKWNEDMLRFKSKNDIIKFCSELNTHLKLIEGKTK